MRLGIISPFTDVDFKPSDWRPTAWRKAEGMHYGSVTSSFPSRKANRGSIFCESTLESDMACLLEVDAAVRTLREQPIGPSWHDGEGWRAGAARDFWVETDAGNMLVEVKEAKELADPEVRWRLRRMALSYRVQGISMVVRSERTIRAEPRLGNTRLLYGYAYSEARRLEADVRLLTSRRPGPMTVAEIRSEMGGDVETLGVLCRLALSGAVELDMARPIGSATTVAWSH
ncbi:hypothetical protein [Methylobacterium oryzae]|uniref:hypothetical protein n=1 Tax=Methylobacterium oryzae TaxID=334852 RepID=UPI002F35CC7E